MTRDCFEPGSAFLLSDSAAVWPAGLATGPDVADDITVRFFADFDI
jgi:hypothetical protein